MKNIEDMKKENAAELNETELNAVSGGVSAAGVRKADFNAIRDILSNRLSITAGLVHLGSSIVDDLGADSLDVVDIVSVVEEEFGVVISQSELAKIKTVDDLVNAARMSK